MPVMRNSSNIGLPNISVVFKEAKEAAGIKMQAAKVAIVLVRETSASQVREIKERVRPIGLANYTLSEADFINRVFDGCYGRTPDTVYLSVASDANAALASLVPYDFDWICGYVQPSQGEDENETMTPAQLQEAIIDWVTIQRGNGKYCKAVVANSDTANSEYIVNFCSDGITIQNMLTAELDAYAFTARICGILSCMPLSQSCTFFVIPEVTKVEVSDDADYLISEGKLILVNDGGKVRIARGVTSCTDPASGVQKIKLICAKDKIRRELEISIKDGFVGKMPNTYDNKCILVTEIKNYLDTLTKLGVLSYAAVGIDPEEQTSYLAQNGKDTGSMTIQQIKEADTGDNVFIAIECTLQDAMENFTINITI